MVVAGLAALTLTPQADTTAQGGLAGWPRLGLYAAAGAALGLSSAGACITYRLHAASRVGWRA